MTTPTDLRLAIMYHKPDPLNMNLPAPPLEDDRGLPPLMREILDTTDPNIAVWSPAHAAWVMARYHEPDMILLAEVIETATIPTVPSEAISSMPPLPVLPPVRPPNRPVPAIEHVEYAQTVNQPPWAVEMERKATPDEVVTRSLNKFDAAHDQEQQRTYRRHHRSKWRRFWQRIARVLIDA